MSGTTGVGRRNSIGTRTSSVGTVYPSAISNWARQAIT